jgi:hypothetical protein
MAKGISDYIPDDSFFKKWLECWPLSETPKSFVLIAGMSALGASLGRKVWIDVDVRKIYPMLNIVFIGPSGLGKTEAITYAQTCLLDHLPADQKPLMIEGESTRPKLTDDLALKSHAIIIAEEMASFFTKQKYQEDMIPFVTELLNYKHIIERRTKSGDVQVVANPSVTFMCGTTVDWLQKQLPNSAVGGGFLPRFFIVTEEQKAQIVPWPDDKLTAEKKEALRKLRGEVSKEFVRIATGTEGKYTFKDQEAIDTFTIWVQSHQAESGHLRPFAERAKEFILRLSLIMAVSRAHKFIDHTDVQIAIGLYEWCMDKLQQVAVPITEEGEMTQNILKLFPDAHSTLSEREVLQAMQNALRADQLYRYLESLVKSGSLKKDAHGTYRRVFQSKGKKSEKQSS